MFTFNQAMFCREMFKKTTLLSCRQNKKCMHLVVIFCKNEWKLIFWCLDIRLVQFDMDIKTVDETFLTKGKNMC